MAEALPVPNKLRGARGSVADAKITGAAPVPSVPAPTAPAKPEAPVKIPAAPKVPIPSPTVIKDTTRDVKAVPSTIEQRILTNLNEGWKNAKDKFADRMTFDAAYGYANKTPEQRAVLDTFWSSKKGSTAAKEPTVKTASGNLSAPALNVVDKGSQNAFKLPAVAAAEKADQLLKDQDDFNKKTLANLESSTSPILAQTRDQYKQYADLIAQTKATYAERIAGLKDLQSRQEQEIDLNKGGQIQAMRANMAAKGITGEAADAAVAQAAYDPKYIKAANEVRKQYLLDITGASDKLGDIISGLTKEQSSLTAAESSILQAIRAKKEELDKAIKDIKASATEATYKPIEDYAKSKTDAAQANDAVNYDVRAEQALWEKSDPVTRTSTLQRKLFSQMGGAAERGLVTNEDYAKAAKMASFAEGQAYLESIIASKKQSNALGLSSAANPVKIDQPVGSFSASSVQAAVDRYSAYKTQAERDRARIEIDSKALSPEDKAALKKILDVVDKANPIKDTSFSTAVKNVDSVSTPGKDKGDVITNKDQQKAIDDAHYVERKLAEPGAQRQYESYKDKPAWMQKRILEEFKSLLNQGKFTQVQYDAFMDKVKAGNAVK